MKTSIIKWSLAVFMIVMVLSPVHLFTDGPSKQLKKQYPWITDELYYYVDLYGTREKLDKDFVFALIQSESEGVRMATSCVGAMSYMQVMPFHNPGNPRALYQPAINIKAGCWFLGYCMRVARGDMIEALKNYNAGPASTYYNMPYIKEVMRNFLISKNITSRPEQGLTWDTLIAML